jgi:UPF0755 protein
VLVAVPLSRKVNQTLTPKVKKLPVPNVAEYLSKKLKAARSAGLCSRKSKLFVKFGRRFIFSALLIIIGLSLAVILSAWSWYRSAFKPVSSGGNPVAVTISVSQPAVSILTDLHQKHLIRSVLAARVYLKLNNLGNHFKPGTYQVLPSESLPQIISQLQKGPADIQVTFPEGWRREQYAARLEAVLRKDPASRFIRSEFLDLTATMEGQLFPDTYYFSVGSSATQVVDRIRQNFRQKTGLDPADPATSKVLILASLVEREAKTDTDRKIISGILVKRLENDWALEIDATVQYVVDTAKCRQKIDCDWWKPIYSTDVASPYNTYKQPGLPPGPICNPGLSAIKAVLQPQKTDYWFYITDNDGVMHYAATLSLHQFNVDKYLRD